MRIFNKLARDERGSSTVEFVLWVPLFGFLLMLTANASFAYLDLTRMENAARDGARRLAINDDAAAVVAYVRSQLPDEDYTIDASCSTNDYACVYVARTTDSMLPFTNFLGVGNLLGKTMGVAIKMRYEPGVKTAEADSARTSSTA